MHFQKLPDGAVLRLLPYMTVSQDYNRNNSRGSSGFCYTLCVLRPPLPMLKFIFIYICLFFLFIGGMPMPWHVSGGQRGQLSGVSPTPCGSQGSGHQACRQALLTMEPAHWSYIQFVIPFLFYNALSRTHNSFSRSSLWPPCPDI